MFERFTERARDVIRDAQDEARQLRHNYIGTEHLLLGLMHGDGAAAQILGALALDLEGIRRRVGEIVTAGDEVRPGQLPFTPRSKKVLEVSLREALSLGHNYVGTEHILLALVRTEEGVASQILEEAEVSEQIVRDEVRTLLSGTRENLQGGLALPLMRKKIEDAKNFALDRGFADVAIELRKIELKLDDI